MNMRFNIENEYKMEMLGEKLGHLLLPGDLIYLCGELGAGKTTLARGIARGLGFNGRVNSPTFTLMNVYNAKCPIYHFDFYRLAESELDDLGLEDYLGRDGICIIEWPEAGQNVLPREAIWIDIELTQNDYDLPRQVIIGGKISASQNLMEGLKRDADPGN